MKSNFNYINRILHLLITIVFFASCNKEKENNMDDMQHKDHKHSALYYCPMHPEVTSDKPGVCPKCGMDLELMPKKMPVDTLAILIQPTNRVVLSQLSPIVASTENHAGRIGALGYLTYNPNDVTTLSARLSGRVEKIYIKYNFEKVNKGQKLLDLYSPELLTAQNEYVYVLQTNDATDDLSKKAIRSKLLNLGMNEREIATLEKTKQVSAIVSIYANVSGHIHFTSDNIDMSAHALSFPTNEKASGMNTNSSPQNVLIREGDYVKKGEDLFTIAGETSIWALFKILPEDIGSIHKDDAVDIIINSTTFSGKVDFIEKSFNKIDDFYTVRVYMICKDHAQLQIGTLIRGYISINNKSTKNLWIPTASVVHLGKGNAAVFIKKQLGYEAYKIQTGKQSFDWIEVLSGLSASDSIAPIASYLIDSEAFISTSNN